MYNRSPSPSFSSRTSIGSFPFPFTTFSSDDNLDAYAVPPLASPPKVKGNYCLFTKKKNEVEMAHQEEGLRIIMLILHNWLSEFEYRLTQGSERHVERDIHALTVREGSFGAVGG